MAEAPAPLPVVCLPGIRGDARIFGPLVDHVGHSTPVLALDLPPGAPALAATRLRPSLPAGPFRVLTGSYGGLVARFLPPHRVAALACVATLPSPAHLQPAMVRRARVLMGLPDTVFEALYAHHARRSLTADGVPPAVVERVLARPLPARVLRGRLRAVLSGHHGGRPAVPTLWIQGRDDPQVTWTPADLHGTPACTVAGGHFPHASHPAGLWAALEAAGWLSNPTHGLGQCVRPSGRRAVGAPSTGP